MITLIRVAGGEVGRPCLSGDIGTARAINSYAIPAIPVAAAEVGGVGGDIARRRELGDESVITSGIRCLIRVADGEVVRKCLPGNIGAARAVNGYAPPVIIATAAEVGGVGGDIARR